MSEPRPITTAAELTDYSDTALLARLFVREGTRYTDWATDRGGPTKAGVTLAAYRDWKGDQVLTSYDLEHAPLLEMEQFYREEHLAAWAWVPAGPLRELLFDCGVLHGKGRAVQWLQRALGVTVDGVVGPETRGALDEQVMFGVYDADGTTERDLCTRLNRQRLAFLGRLVHRDPSQVANLEGWMARVGEFL